MTQTKSAETATDRIEGVGPIARVPVECWEIPEGNGLDPIQVFWRDVAPGAGYVTIICYGKAWTAYFGGMGEDTIQQFFAEADTSYMVGRMGDTAPLLRGRVKQYEDYLGRITEAVRAAVRSGGAA